jgi:2'-5' RNA ligase
MIAVEPAIPVVERLVVAQEDLADALHHLGGDMQWTAAEQMRLNLRVLDAVDEDWLHRLREQLRVVARSRRTLTWQAGGLRWAPDADRPQILAAMATGDTSELEGLQRQIDMLCDVLGVPAPAMPWKAALSLGRMRVGGERPRLEGVLQRWESAAWGVSTSRELVVVRTDLQGAVVRTRVVERIAFGATVGRAA